MSVPSYPFHSFPLKLPNKRIDFPFPPLKLPNKGMEEYSKIIFLIPFHSIPFLPPNQGLNMSPLAPSHSLFGKFPIISPIYIRK